MATTVKGLYKGGIIKPLEDVNIEFLLPQLPGHGAT